MGFKEVLKFFIYSCEFRESQVYIVFFKIINLYRNLYYLYIFNLYFFIVYFIFLVL